MSLPKAYNRHLMDNLGLRAVWEPGSALPLGAIVARREAGVFTQLADLAQHEIPFIQASSQKKKLSLESEGTKQRIIQGGAEIAPGQLDLEAQAELKLSFNGASQFMLKTDELIGTKITNLEAVADKAAKVPGWDFDRHCIVSEVFIATSFSFLGTRTKSSEVSFAGKASGIISFLTLGLNLDLQKSGKASVELIGQGGPVAMVLARVKENGDPTFDI